MGGLGMLPYLEIRLYLETRMEVNLLRLLFQVLGQRALPLSLLLSPLHARSGGLNRSTLLDGVESKKSFAHLLVRQVAILQSSNIVYLDSLKHLRMLLRGVRLCNKDVLFLAELDSLQLGPLLKYRTLHLELAQFLIDTLYRALLLSNRNH